VLAGQTEPTLVLSLQRLPILMAGDKNVLSYLLAFIIGTDEIYTKRIFIYPCYFDKGKIGFLQPK